VSRSHSTPGRERRGRRLGLIHLPDCVQNNRPPISLRSAMA